MLRKAAGFRLWMRWGRLLPIGAKFRFFANRDTAQPGIFQRNREIIILLLFKRKFSLYNV